MKTYQFDGRVDDAEAQHQNGISDAAIVRQNLAKDAVDAPILCRQHAKHQAKRIRQPEWTNCTNVARRLADEEEDGRITH